MRRMAYGDECPADKPEENPVSPRPPAPKPQLDIELDIAYVLDCTPAMVGRLDGVKEHVGSFYKTLIEQFVHYRWGRLRRLRVRVAAFGSCPSGSAETKRQPLLESGFFTLTEQEAEFRAFVNALEFAPGGDAPPFSLPALYRAFRSVWADGGEENVRHRQILYVITNSPPGPLDSAGRLDSAYAALYPEGMPDSFSGLEDAFCDPALFPAYPPRSGHLTGRRLCVCASKAEIWGTEQSWEQLLEWEGYTLLHGLDPERGFTRIALDEVASGIFRFS